MRNENIWLCIKALASSLDGSREEGEQMLDSLEGDLRGLPAEKVKEAESEIILIAAQLSRLSMRMRQ